MGRELLARLLLLILSLMARCSPRAEVPLAASSTSQATTRVAGGVGLPTAWIAPSPPAPPLPATPIPSTATPSATPTNIPPRPTEGPAPVSLSDIYMVDATSGWGIGEIGGRGARVVYTHDGGFTWEDISPAPLDPLPAGEEYGAVGFFSNESAAWVLFYRFRPETTGPLDLEQAPVWHTEDGGKTWEPLGALLGVHPIERPWTPVFAFDSQGQTGLGFVRDGSGAQGVLLRSGDGGKTWEEVTPGGGADRAYIESCLISGMQMDLTDGGSGWISLGTDGNACYLPEGANEFVGILTTSDGGMNWGVKALPPPPSDPGIFADEGHECFTQSPTLFSPREGALVVECLGPRSEYYARTNFVYRTTNGGTSWTISSYPGGVLTFSDRTHAWSIGKCCGLANMMDIDASVDGGRTWKLIASEEWVSSLGGAEAGISFVSKNLGWVTVGIANGQALMRTVDGGTTWEELQPVTALTTGAVSCPAPCTTTPSPLPLASRTPTSAPGAIPHLVSGQDFQITGIHMIDKAQGWAIGLTPRRRLPSSGPREQFQPQQPHVLYTRDGGNMWQDVTPPELSPAQDLLAFGEFLDADRAWVIFYPTFGVPDLARVWRTQDGGRSWRPSEPLPSPRVDLGTLANFRPGAMAFEDRGQRGWLMVDRLEGGVVALYRTDDGGQSWKLLIDGGVGRGNDFCNWTGMAIGGGKLVWLTVFCSGDIGPAARVYVTQDGGTTWESRRVPVPQAGAATVDKCRTHSPALFSEEEGALILTCGKFEESSSSTISRYLSTDDGGRTWRTRLFPGGELQSLNPSTAWAIGTASGYYPELRLPGEPIDIYQSLDGGLTWAPLGPVSWSGQFNFVTESLGWAVARSDEESALVRTTDGGRNWTILEPRIGPESPP